jgi:HSP20 family protein
VWDPLHELTVLHERATRCPSPKDAGWTPQVDLLETAVEYQIVAELPGLAEGDFSIDATSDGLVLSGQRPAPNPPPDRYLRMERGQGRFVRAFSFGEPIDVGAIKASFDRGLLGITVPKLNAPVDRRIAIR